MEVAIIVDVLRRAAISTTLAGLDGREAVVCSRGLSIVPDVSLDDAGDSYQALVLPGGAEGARRLGDSERVGELLRAFARGKLVGALCAAPTALVRHGVFVGRKMTCHPSVRDIVWLHADVEPADHAAPMVEDGNLLTGVGPGASFTFALAIASRLVGVPRALSLVDPLTLPRTMLTTELGFGGAS